MSVEQVYIATARHIIIVEKKLDILLDVELRKAETNMPSWVPDWRQPLPKSERSSSLIRYCGMFSKIPGTWTELKDHHRTMPHREHEGRIVVNEPVRSTVKSFRLAKVNAVGERSPTPNDAEFANIVGRHGSGAVWRTNVAQKVLNAPTDKTIAFA